MIAITPKAQEKLSAFLAEKKAGPGVRIQSASGCGGEERLILTLDQPAQGDISADFGPLTLCLSRDLCERVGRVRVDFREESHDSGFVVESQWPLAAASGGCAGCTACG